MNVETIVSDVKGRVEPIVAKGQDVVFYGFEVLKSANTIVVDGVTSVYRTNLAVGKDLVGYAQTSFTKAKSDGIKAVAANPAAYLPEGKDALFGALSATRETVIKTGDELVKTFKSGFETITAKLNGETVEAKVKASATKAKATVKKTAASAKKTVRKTAAKA